MRHYGILIEKVIRLCPASRPVVVARMRAAPISRPESDLLLNVVTQVKLCVRTQETRSSRVFRFPPPPRSVRRFCRVTSSSSQSSSFLEPTSHTLDFVFMRRRYDLGISPCGFVGASFISGLKKNIAQLEVIVRLNERETHTRKS